MCNEKANWEMCEFMRLAIHSMAETPWRQHSDAVNFTIIPSRFSSIPENCKAGVEAHLTYQGPCKATFMELKAGQHLEHR